jgi:hypothetical protein
MVNLILFDMEVLAYLDRMLRCGTQAKETTGFTKIRGLYGKFFSSE